MENDKYIILSEKKWNSDLANQLKMILPKCEWITISTKNEFNAETLSKFNPKKIFIPHWSYIISEDIFENYECIVFHMTDLPYGRGGSPLQNLIIRGHKETRISAIKVVKGIDAGPIYLKKPLDLSGTAYEIFKRANNVIFQMIIEIIKSNNSPTKQQGVITEFKRRKPKDSNIENLHNLEKVYDYIRMLDCEGYPSAYIETSQLKFEFRNANFDINEEIITANVRIIKK